MKRIIILLSLVLCSCTWFTREKPPEKVNIQYPANLLAECREISKLDNATMGELLKHDTELMFQYEECALRHKKLKEAIMKDKQ